MTHRKITFVLMTIEEITDDKPSRSSLPAAPVADNDDAPPSVNVRPLAKILSSALLPRKAVGS